MSIETYQYKKLLEELKNYRGTGTSVITLLLTPNSNINQTKITLKDALSSAQRIKSSL
jgi:peptide subunit release factor 1 (eRF1)